MKKKLLVLLSFVLSLVMCFSFIACNGDEEDNVLIADKASAAFDNLLTSEGYKGEASLTYTSDVNTGLAAYEKTLSFEKRGNRVMVQMPVLKYPEAPAAEGLDAAPETVMMTMIVDIDTGYVYTAGDNGKYAYEQLFPQGTFDYLMGALRAQTDGEQSTLPTNDELNYDGKTRTMSFDVDFASEINGLVDPLYKAYKNGDNMLQLVNAYLPVLSDGKYKNLDGVFAEISSKLPVVKALTGKDVLDMLAGYGVDVYELLAAQGIELDAETKAKIESRTVGEMIVAVFDYINEAFATPTDGDLTDGDSTADDGSADDGALPSDEEQLQALIMGALDAMINAEVDPATVDAKLTAAVATANVLATTMLTETDVKKTLDTALADNPVLLDVIQNSVKFDKLGASFTVKFDGDYNIAELVVTAGLKHTRKSEGAVGFFADNNYNVNMSLKLHDYTSTASDFEFDIAEKGELDYASAVVYSGTTTSFDVYVEELDKFDVTSDADALVVTLDDDTDTVDLEEGDITVNKAKKTVTVSQKFIKRVLGENKSVSVILGFENGGEYAFSIFLDIYDRDTDSVTAFVTDLFDM